MRHLPIIALITILALPALAGEESVVVADGWVPLTSGFNSFGPNAVDVATDGDAVIRFVWYGPDSRTTIIKSDPAAALGDTAYALRAELPPRSFVWGGPGPDACYIDIDTTAEVIVTW